MNRKKFKENISCTCGHYKAHYVKFHYEKSHYDKFQYEKSYYVKFHYDTTLGNDFIQAKKIFVGPNPKKKW